MKLLYRLVLSISIFSFMMCHAENKTQETQEAQAEHNLFIEQLRAKAQEAKAYCKEKKFSTEYCFLIDFNIHSGKNRFFVWDFANDTIKYEGLCCHGYGQKSTQEKPVFSNVR